MKQILQLSSIFWTVVTEWLMVRLKRIVIDAVNTKPITYKTGAHKWLTTKVCKVLNKLNSIQLLTQFLKPDILVKELDELDIVKLWWWTVHFTPDKVSVFIHCQFRKILAKNIESLVQRNS